MTNFIERIKTEREELGEKIAKLEAFLQGDKVHQLERQAQLLLASQMGAMSTYAMILDARLEALR